MTERECGRPSSLIRSHGLLLGGPSRVLVGLGGLAPSDPSSSLAGFPGSPHVLIVFCRHRPRMKDDKPRCTIRRNSLGVLPFMSLQEVLIELFLSTGMERFPHRFRVLGACCNLCQLPLMEQTSANTIFSRSLPNLRPTTIYTRLTPKRPLTHPWSSLTTQRWELNLLLALCSKTKTRTEQLQALRRPPMCLIQPRVSPGLTVDKCRLRPRFLLCCFLLP